LSVAFLLCVLTPRSHNCWLALPKTHKQPATTNTTDKHPTAKTTHKPTKTPPPPKTKQRKFPRVPIMALTATATEAVRADIMAILGMPRALVFKVGVGVVCCVCVCVRCAVMCDAVT
jgi:hypothetical protein